jgi:hypothetical protein
MSRLDNLTHSGVALVFGLLGNYRSVVWEPLLAGERGRNA